jgi:carbon-monoxide dehydrogenase large subunit
MQDLPDRHIPDHPNRETGAYVGQPIKRVEDQRLLTGSGCFVADVALDAMAHLVVVRSPHPAARILAIDLAPARNRPGVLGIWTGADIAAEGLGGIPWEVRPPDAPTDLPLGDPAIAPPQPILADGVVRYQGEPVAVVVAETLAAAEEAAELLAIDYAPAPRVIGAHDAVRPDAARVWQRFPGNLCFTAGVGDAAAAAAGFARAAHVIALATDIPRLVQNPMETRGYVGSYDPAAERYLLQAAAGKPATIGRAIAQDVLHIPRERIRVIARDVGGGFGAKNPLYAEAVLVLWTARKVGRPVRWIASRSESFLSDMQARDQMADAALALDAEGRILALRVALLSDLGGYLSPRGVTSPYLPCHMITGVYDIPALDLTVRAVHTNTVPTCTYRGAGAPEAVFVVERLIDLAARQLGLTPGELRRRNLIPAAAMPYATLLGTTYDSGDFLANMDEAERLADIAGFAARRADSERRGLKRGLGYANLLEACGYGIAEQAEVACAPDGSVTVRIGTMSNGQSHQTVYAQMLADRLGVAFERIAILQGDSDDTPDGMGTGASRSMTVGGSALVLAADRVIEIGLEIAADLLETAAADIAYDGGVYRVVGTDRAVRLEAVAAKLVADGAPRGLVATHRFDPVAPTFPSGCHIAEVEVDPETGEVALVAYSAAHDVGRALNPLVVEAQLVGGVAQGVGEALLEVARFDRASGQLVTGSFMDYAMPRATDMPAVAVRILEFPCRTTPTGIKAVGEAGPTAAPAAIVNAIVDALGPLGVRHVEMPATPETVFRAIAAAQTTS